MWILLLSLFLLDKDSSFYIFSVMKYERNLLFNAMHKDWYICQELYKVEGRQMILDFYKGEPDVLQRCSFSVYPLLLGSNKFMNCKNVLGPVKHREINGQPLPHPPHLIPIPPPPPSALSLCLPVCQEQKFPSSVEVSSVPENARMSYFLTLKNDYRLGLCYLPKLKAIVYWLNDLVHQICHSNSKG